MRPRECMTTLPSSELESAMFRARRAGREARRDGRDGEAALWCGLLADLDLERKLRRYGGLEQRSTADRLRSKLRDTFSEEGR